MSHEPPPVVVLDIDGTLVDSVYLHVRAWHHALARVGLEVPSHRVHAAIGMGGDRIVAHLTNQAAEDSLGEEIRETHRSAFTSMLGEVRPTTGARSLVDELLRRGYEVAIASSADADLTRDLLAIAEVDGLVSPVATGDEVEDSKPHPEVVELSGSRAAGTPVLMVGDAVWDALAAAEAGVPCVGVRTGGFADQTLLDAGMVRVVEDPQELAEQLGDLL